MVSVRQYQQLKGISKNFSYGLGAGMILVILLSFFTQICSALIQTPPYTPSSPSPSDGAQNQPVNLRLSWLGGDSDGDTVTYTIYIDTSPSFNTANARTFTVTSDTYEYIKVAYGTTYYWSVSASDGVYYTTNNPVWSFTTQILSAPTAPAPTTPAPTAPAPTACSPDSTATPNPPVRCAAALASAPGATCTAAPAG
ncbi:Uncharacterised protein [uncultured archaeon]|nr:Uncharacterised protein [uncultured archaeon]